jgi:threonine/homoserine/homoserine lactone efflux protein
MDEEHSQMNIHTVVAIMLIISGVVNLVQAITILSLRARIRRYARKTVAIQLQLESLEKNGWFK